MSRLIITVVVGLSAACAGCGGAKTTADLIADLKAGPEKERLIAVRLLPERKAEAATVVPALADALGQPDADIRLSAAIGLGYFGEQARVAIPALQAAHRDTDARVRRAAGVALSRIDPHQFPAAEK